MEKGATSRIEKWHHCLFVAYSQHPVHTVCLGHDKENSPRIRGTCPVAGWLHTKILDQTGNVAWPQGWKPCVLDIHGEGILRDVVNAQGKTDPSKDKLIKTDRLRIPQNIAFGIRGGDLDMNGVVWGSASSGDTLSFDRRKCRALPNVPNWGRYWLYDAALLRSRIACFQAHRLLSTANETAPAYSGYQQIQICHTFHKLLSFGLPKNSHVGC